ncbi:MAG: hypothetical protein GX936_04605, partial [Clostridiales bacterium]|nr:hypothetical protein [Clostridiales bacterium]
AAGRYVGGGTVKFDSRKDGLNGETSENGIVGTHAYTVIDTELRSIQGRDYKFIKVRNPWGNSVRQYYTREGQEGLQAEKESSGNQGIFLIEFSDFIRKFKEVEIN